MLRLVCDRCENEIDPVRDERWRVETSMVETNAGQTADLCSMCAQSLGDFLNGAMLNDASVRFTRERIESGSVHSWERK